MSRKQLPRGQRSLDFDLQLDVPFRVWSSAQGEGKMKRYIMQLCSLMSIDLTSGPYYHPKLPFKSVDPYLSMMPTTNGANGITHSWSSLPNAMEKLVSGLNKTLNSDRWWQAFVDTKAIIEPVTFSVQSVGSNDAVIVNVSPGAKTNVTTGNPSKADFTLSAKPEQLEKFFDKDPKAPYTSFVGLQVRGICPSNTSNCTCLLCYLRP
jgi:hypothetical protein